MSLSVYFKLRSETLLSAPSEILSASYNYSPGDSHLVDGWDPRVDTDLAPEEFCTNCVWKYHLSTRIGVYECMGHENPDFASEKKGFWYGPVKDPPKSLRHVFTDRDGNVLYDEVIHG